MAASTAIPLNWNKIAEKIGRRLRAEYGKRFGKRKQRELAPEVVALQSCPSPRLKPHPVGSRLS
jgi:hypothetical protein